MTEVQTLANAGPWDGDGVSCAMCAATVATWFVGGEGWCADCLARAAINAVAGELDRAERAEADWQPPPERDRPYWFKCLGWITDRWRIVAWNGQAWWCDEVGNRVTPTDFHALPQKPVARLTGDA